MEKLQFRFQVFAAVLALPLLSMMELNHNKKTLPLDNTSIEQKLTGNPGNYYFENNSKTNTDQKKQISRRYCK
jgi:hypothetical protein